MRTFYSYVLAGWLLCAGGASSAAPVSAISDEPGKPALVTTLPAVPAQTPKSEMVNQKDAKTTTMSVRKDKSGSKKVWLIVGIGAALALLRILL
ncbi:hypothetical protein MUN84_06770 [Hymenobacter sp. 5516J-16]|uniref:hypothetical protein n=1 Tax=Hymenobacter sp. 5516J-16 TaxID=2932253 RepID=UPI001FCFF8E5|nr:hypothetical protein [Hymenobacter sp. 5516J-16]UOQ78280.1 hypothetical protein MUN84_06770 [Hymenobacter sp. 5516J-16]